MTVIPGALADHLTSQTITDADTVAALDGARRGRGRTLVIEPTSTRVLHVISAYAEAILENRKLHTAAKVRAARLWIQRAGHSVPAPTVDDQAEDAARVSVHRYIARELPAVADLLDIDRAPTDAETDKFDRTARAVDAVEHAEQVEAAVETVEDAEALYAARLVTEAEAVDNTWRGAWIGEQPAEAALFVVDGMVEQGALFAPGVDDCRVAREPIVVRASFLPTDLDRIKAKAQADRSKYRAETDDRIAAECAAHGVAPSQGVQDRIAARAGAEQTPARRAIEGVVVTHNGTAQGSTPADATHPNVTAARAALDGLAVATMTDRHDVSEPTEDEQRVRGYLIDPREGDRVAVYWLEAGRIVRRDTPWHGPALDCLADRLTRRGWTVEPMLKSSQCVFAHRPPVN